MFTAKVHDVRKEAGAVYITVTFEHSTDTSLSFTQSFRVSTLNNLKQTVKSRIDELAALYTFADSVPTGPLDTSGSGPTQAELDKHQFFVDYHRWLSVKRAIDAEILTGTEPKVVELKNKVIAAFKPAYLTEM